MHFIFDLVNGQNINANYYELKHLMAGVLFDDSVLNKFRENEREPFMERRISHIYIESNSWNSMIGIQPIRSVKT